VQCPRCHESVSPAALACAGCAAPLRLGDDPPPLLLDRPVDLDRRTRGPTPVPRARGVVATPRRLPLIELRDEGPGLRGGGRAPALRTGGTGPQMWGLDPDRDFELDRDLGRAPDPDPDRALDRPSAAPLRSLVAAGLLDAAIIAAAAAPPLLLAAWELHGGAHLFRTLLPAALALWALLAVTYTSLLHGLMGATLGDRLLGLAVIDGSGRTPSLGRAGLRASLALVGVAALGLGLLLAPFTLGRRTLHDRVAGTFVVRAP
jgi:uncharacterized RDD family membrane protein YckC